MAGRAAKLFPPPPNKISRGEKNSRKKNSEGQLHAPHSNDVRVHVHTPV